MHTSQAANGLHANKDKVDFSNHQQLIANLELVVSRSMNRIVRIVTIRAEKFTAIDYTSQIQKYHRKTTETPLKYRTTTAYNNVKTHTQTQK